MKGLGIVTGILMVILGIYTATIPFRTFLGIGWLLGGLFLVHGIQMVVRALSLKKKDILQCVLGALVILGGAVLLFNGIQRFLTDVMVACMIGGSVIAYGVIEICNGFKTMKVSKGISILKIICGVLSVILGIAAVMHPFMTMFSVGYIIAFSIVFQGVDMILLSLSMGKKVEE